MTNVKFNHAFREGNEFVTQIGVFGDNGATYYCTLYIPANDPHAWVYEHEYRLPCPDWAGDAIDAWVRDWFAPRVDGAVVVEDYEAGAHMFGGLGFRGFVEKLQADDYGRFKAVRIAYDDAADADKQRINAAVNAAKSAYRASVKKDTVQFDDNGNIIGSDE